MAVETATYLDDLVPANPGRNDFLAEGDNHIGLLKSVLQNTFTNANQAFDMTLIAGSIVPVGTIAMFYSATPPTGWKLCDGQTWDRSDSPDPLNPLQITTPDLQGLFVRVADPLGTTAEQHGGTGGSNATLATTSSAGAHAHAGSTGASGSHSHGGATGGHALTIAQMPAHSHGGGNHRHTFAAASYSYTAPGGVGYQGVVQQGNVTMWTDYSGNTIASEGSNAAHTHPVSVDGSHVHAITVNSSGAHTHPVTVATLPAYYALTYIMKI